MDVLMFTPTSDGQQQAWIRRKAMGLPRRLQLGRPGTGDIGYFFFPTSYMISILITMRKNG